MLLPIKFEVLVVVDDKTDLLGRAAQKQQLEVLPLDWTLTSLESTSKPASDLCRDL